MRIEIFGMEKEVVSVETGIKEEQRCRRKMKEGWEEEKKSMKCQGLGTGQSKRNLKGFLSSMCLV